MGDCPACDRDLWHAGCTVPDNLDSDLDAMEAEWVSGSGNIPALALIAEVRRLRGRLEHVWDEGYWAAYEMARGWGHVDHWEAPYPANPYEAETP